MNETDVLTITIPTGNRDHEIIVLIVTLVILTFLALSVAKFVRRKLESVKCTRNKNKTSCPTSEDENEATNLNKS